MQKLQASCDVTYGFYCLIGEKQVQREVERVKISLINSSMAVQLGVCPIPVKQDTYLKLNENEDQLI